jgi:hypothetical protein
MSGDNWSRWDEGFGHGGQIIPFVRAQQNQQKILRVSNFVGLATEPTETFEFFLNELSVLCG